MIMMVGTVRSNSTDTCVCPGGLDVCRARRTVLYNVHRVITRFAAIYCRTAGVRSQASVGVEEEHCRGGGDVADYTFLSLDLVITVLV